ncbi:RNA ligase [Pantoea phage Phynn]|nr:RNA ligase [Pantoea phage Phynn]
MEKTMKSFLEVVKPVVEAKDPGVYMCAKFDQSSNDEIKKLQKKLGVANPVVSDKLHSTIVYSRKTVDLFPSEDLNEYARLVGLEVWNTKYGNSVIGILHSDYLTSRFSEVMSMGATYDYEDYKPHVTLAYDAGDVVADDLLSRAQLPIDLRIISEHAESLDLDKDVADITGTEE